MADSFEMRGGDDDDDLYVSDSETEFFSINTDDTSSSDEGVELTNDIGQLDLSAEAASMAPVSLSAPTESGYDDVEMEDYETKTPALSSKWLDINQPVSYNRHSNSKPESQERDLVHRIKGLYKLLDIYAEEGSGGIVDKIIIDQESSGNLINHLSPGAYRNLTKVDFKAMDSVNIQPVGLYGSKDELIRFFMQLKVVDDDTEKLLREPYDPSRTKPTLRPGLYGLVMQSDITDNRSIFIVFWPEEKTWDDDASSSVSKNRTTFMRFLTKLTDQIIVLVSEEDGRKLVWEKSKASADETDPKPIADEEVEESDRLFNFEVSKAVEQEENVQTRNGFTIKSSYIGGCAAPKTGMDPSIDARRLRTRLVSGDCNQALLSASYNAAVKKRVPFQSFPQNGFQLRQQLFESGKILRLSRGLSLKAISVLIEHGLKDIYGLPISSFQNRLKEAGEKCESDKKARIELLLQDMQPIERRICSALKMRLLNSILNNYPKLGKEDLRGVLGGGSNKGDEEFLAKLLSVNSKFKAELNKSLPPQKELLQIGTTNQRMNEAMKKVFICDRLFSSHKLSGKHQTELWSLVSKGIDEKDMDEADEYCRKNGIATVKPNGIIHRLVDKSTSLWYSKLPDGPVKDTADTVAGLEASNFLTEADRIAQKWHVLTDGVTKALQIARDHYSNKIDDTLRNLPQRLAFIHAEYLKDRIKKECEAELEKVQKVALSKLFSDFEEQSKFEDRPETMVLEELEVLNINYYAFSNGESYRCSGYQIVETQPSTTYTLRLLELLEEDKQRIQSDTQYVPTPQFRDRPSYQFSVPSDLEIHHIQLLAKKKCLLILEDCKHNMDIYLEPLETLDAAVQNKRIKKHIHGERLGQDVVIAYNETKRTLVVCTCDTHNPSLQIHTFVFDEAFTSLQGQGSPIELARWYNEMARILSMHFMPGTGEIALVEANGRVRAFSPVTLQFRPSALELSASPIATYTTPDGSCLVAVLDGHDGHLRMQVYHWASLGSRDGFTFDLPISSQQLPIVSSLEDRKNVHLMWIVPGGKACRSLALDIKCLVTEFQFVRTGNKLSSHKNTKKSFHNSLIDCHSDVWNRFPVVPAICRKVISTDDLRRDKLLSFATDAAVSFSLPSYFRDMVINFEKVAKKPTDRVLKDIVVQKTTFSSVLSDLYRSDFWNGISTFKAGEWMVDFFCLIPIHIALARDNQFIPLKDGVWSPGEERALLGTNINQVAASLSFGWYESILQSYMSSKPVKVVSSMGEQSVGKSFALNHLTDTSFAGSAMRTTEGVWMSVTPTDKELIVSMDFEGVHSIERSAQEDMLLVLFNAAISNLVMFRNNFTLSREITNLFQSFQSSSSILDPQANPTLFQATLDVIIKDVVDSDKNEIVKEYALPIYCFYILYRQTLTSSRFELKLRRIVQEEQATNFISNLYRNNISIIPWPVIESRQFHVMFDSLRRQLGKKASTHEGGVKFLAKLKMLMAKLKSSDWGALSQNMSIYRAQQLLSFLPNALMHGTTEAEPDFEPLKNFDTSEVIEVPDSDAFLWLEGRVSNHEISKEEALVSLMERWPDFSTRSQWQDKEWMKGLTSFIREQVEQRIVHVQTWVNSNISQSTATNSSVEELRRTLDSKIVELQRNVEICAQQCGNCRLLCMRARFHEGIHDCRTDHECPQACQFSDEHSNEIDKCYLKAGHDGLHICDTTAHLCGLPCDLIGKKGCQGKCTKVPNHEENEHMCSTKRHLCGNRCGLQGVMTPDGRLFSCQDSCSVEWDEVHDLCVCEAPNGCPIACQLCGHLCSSTDHLHGLENGVAHLCKQEHNCTSLCGSLGVCEINTEPHSIEATFNGTHDKFQYTKYSQVTKRLRCAVTIAPGELSHDGPHIHSTKEQVFHYCDAKCANCGYVCISPYGHPQPEHSTSHGSMSKTQWAIDGPSGTIFELDGHKFGSSDDGAPMLCNMLCSSLGRHAHIDYCRSTNAQLCDEEGTSHIHSQVEPNPDRAKDWVTHKLYWERLGFRDPYPREEQNTFAKCDAMCSGPEHQATATDAAQPSYCTEPMFHLRAAQNSAPSGGYVSNDGHIFACKNPVIMSQAFHVIFVIDRSGSMASTDRRPLVNHPTYSTISRVADNRLGAVFSALYSFWSARAAVFNQAAGTGASRRDAYSIILFNDDPVEIVQNDFSMNPDELLSRLLIHDADGWTNFDGALTSAEQVMQQHWSTERTPVVIFLSDGISSVEDSTVYSLCRTAVSLGKSLSLHAVSFGCEADSLWLRRMVTIAQEVQQAAPRDPLIPANATVESSYNVALDSVHLAETFLGLADSLHKTRGGLISH